MADKVVVKLDGAANAQRILNRLSTRIATDARNVIAKRALLIQGALRQKLSHAGGGRSYRRGRTWHTASAPGEPPAVDTGRLRNSIAVYTLMGGIAAEVGTNVQPYPEWLEDGTPGGKIAPRPWLSPVWREQEPQYLLDMAEALKLLERGV